MGDNDTKLIRLPLEASDQQILNAVRTWCAALAAEDYEGARSMVRAPGWTAEKLRKTIEGYDGYNQSGEYPHRLSPLDTAEYRPGDEPVNNPWPRHEVDRDEGLISVWFDLPLDGYWSDLTATFSVETEGHATVLYLDMVHVM
ncbi:hypothetical protein [Phyllobacterium sp. YR531]|uniref:hypothetical protein n=1 Tax=Phyllobacterium sp. YR531 TaxID=1144343 RepID=UPI00026FBACA|nr:hypothetical protein [Phyllobacterium sp. YR531]EJN04238.1 hypothetical protein PMI41_01877 [Phyllobacterium sp. YR531]